MKLVQIMCFTFILLHLTQNCRKERTFSRPDRSHNDIQRSFYNFQVDVSQLKVSFFPRKWSFDNFNHVFAFPNLRCLECLIVLLFSWQKIAVDSKTLIILQYSSFSIILHQTTFSTIFYMFYVHYSTCFYMFYVYYSTSFDINEHNFTSSYLPISSFYIILSICAISHNFTTFFCILHRCVSFFLVLYNLTFYM